jgi:hypothetical protein
MERLSSLAASGVGTVRGTRERLDWATPATLIRVALWGFVTLLVTRTLADPDLWGHLRFGLDMLASGSVHTADPYSFTSDRPWVNHEWLAEVVTALAYTALGAPGLTLLKVGVIGAVAAIAWAIATQEGARPLGRDLFVLLVVFGTYSRSQVVRPQLFSVLFFCLLLWLLRTADRGCERAFIAVPLCFAVWANFHGGWIVGLATLAVWAAGDAWQQWNRRRTLVLSAVATCSLLATLANPYGPGLWRFLAATVGLSRPEITDWQPLLQFSPGMLLIEALLPAVALGAAWLAGLRPAAHVRDLAVIAVLAAATLRLGRTDAFLQLAIAALLAGPIVGLLNRVDGRVRGHFARPSLPVAALVVLLAGRVLMGAVDNLATVRVRGYWIPDQAAALALKEARPGARVLTWFDWGEYALWQLSPAGIRISMDGRRETVYSAGVIDDHFRFYAGDEALADYPDRIGADHVWLPSRFPMVETLTRRGWIKALDTGASVVLARGGPPIEPRAATASEAFPWP